MAVIAVGIQFKSAGRGVHSGLEWVPHRGRDGWRAMGRPGMALFRVLYFRVGPDPDGARGLNRERG